MNYSSQDTRNKSVWYRHLSIKWQMRLVLIVGVTTFAACGKSGREGESTYPPPGQMHMVMMESAAQLYSTDNLITNGDFSLWDGEGLIPEGFSVPKDRTISYIIQRDDRGGPGKHSVDQYWHKSDVGTPPHELFHTVVADVQPGGVYELNVHARTYDDTTANISVFVLDSNGAPVTAYLNAITVAPGRDEFRKHSCLLKADSLGTWLIASHTNDNTPYRGRIIWLEWRLTESSTILGDILQPQPFTQ